MFLLFAVQATSSLARESEFVELPGHKIKNDYTDPLPHEWLDASSLPDTWDWGNMNGTSYLTHNLNQHIPQYCGSCWAHGALSSLGDRIKIQRMKTGMTGPDINLSIQYILNCGSYIAGSCHGGSATGTFEFIKRAGNVPYSTCQQYLACSHESREGFCNYVDTTCSPSNTCLTCSTFKSGGGVCNALDYYPNATIAQYGTLDNADAIKAEIYARGPVAAGVNAVEILEYTGGVIDMPRKSKEVDHIVSITGWASDEQGQYWIVRNSWGEYWGERGFFRIRMGGNQLGIEGEVSWAIPGSWTESNIACYEDGTNCLKKRQRAGRGFTHEDFQREARKQLETGRV